MPGIDEPGIELLKAFAADVQFFCDTRPEILDEHVRIGCQSVEYFEIGSLPRVQRQAALLRL